MFRFDRWLPAAALTIALASTGEAYGQSDIQLIRPGDADMSCEALAKEINGLTADQAKAAKRAESGKKLLGFATTALQVAGPMLSSGMSKMGGDATGAMMIQQAMGQMQAQAMQQQQQMGVLTALGGMSGMGGGAEPAPAATIESQRLARLHDLRALKAC